MCPTPCAASSVSGLVTMCQSVQMHPFVPSVPLWALNMTVTTALMSIPVLIVSLLIQHIPGIAKCGKMKRKSLPLSTHKALASMKPGKLWNNGRRTNFNSIAVQAMQMLPRLRPQSQTAIPARFSSRKSWRSSQRWRMSLGAWFLQHHPLSLLGHQHQKIKIKLLLPLKNHLLPLPQNHLLPLPQNHLLPLFNNLHLQGNQNRILL